MTRTSGFLGDPNKRRRIRTLRRVRLMIVREIIDTNVDMEGDDKVYDETHLKQTLIAHSIFYDYEVDK